MRRTAVFVATLVGALPLASQSFVADSAFLASFSWRGIGPANMGGRVSDIEANPLNPKVIYAAFATGGLWRSRNAGTTWESIFDSTGVGATSDIAIAPSDTNVIWVGTGEPNSRNSISPGSGVFRSTDGGNTWTHVGLEATQHIGRVLVHPTDPNTAWVAALGHAWGSNPERGIYKTTDAGATWRRVHFVSDAAGAVDLAMDPTNPNVLLASTWERVRGPYFLKSGGPGSGIWRSTDGGETWSRMTAGLPTTTLGRIGLAIAPSDANVAYALLEADSNPNPASLRRGFVPDTSARQRLQSGLFRSADGGVTWTRMNNENNRPFYYSQIRVDPRNPDRVYWVSTRARFSNDGGRSWREVGQPIHVDFHALWIDPNDPDHYITGSDGGVSQTFDRGGTYDALLLMGVGQFYAVGVDMQRPFWICGGLQDNGTWCGPSQSLRGRIGTADWTNVSGGDGFYAQIDPTNPDMVYTESQGGAIGRMDMATWSRSGIRPGGGGFGGGDITRARNDTLVMLLDDSVSNRAAIAALRTRMVADTVTLAQNRFNWQAPFQLSPHNPRTLYMGGHRVWKSVNQGDDWMPISEDLSTIGDEQILISMTTTGGITRDATNAETHGTVTTLAESPVRPGLLWAGTDDGNVWLTRNDGTTWENITRRFTGLPAGTWVSRVEPSRVDSATVYVTFDGHRTDDFRPWVYVSTDFGRTFRPIINGIPSSEYVHVIREHPRRPDLLFLGTERAAYVSTNRGASWQRFSNGLPPVPVHDLVIHPRDRTLVAGTHGRSVYVIDIGPLEEATDSTLAAGAHLFAIEPALLYNSRGGGGAVGLTGSRGYVMDNPPSGAIIPFRIVQGEVPRAGRGRDTTAAGGPGRPGGAGGPGGFGGAGGGGGLAALLRPDTPPSPGDTLMIVITDAGGDTVRTITTNARVTPLRRITWDLRGSPDPLSPSQVRDSIRTAERRAAVRDSLRAVMRDTTNANRPQLRDPEPTEPGQWENPALAQLGFGGFGGGRGGGRGGFAGRGALVEPGTYLVTIRLNGAVYRQTVQVVRPEQTSALTGGWK